MTNDGPSPPTVGLNVNVAETPSLPATRSAAATVNDTETTALIEPDATGVEAVRSALVCTVTDVLPEVGAPMVMPNSVTVTAVLAASAVPPVVMMMDVAPGAPGDRVAPIVDSVALGVAVVAKKPEG